MPSSLPISRPMAALWTVAATLVSGGLSALTFGPAMQVMETISFDDLIGVLTTFAVTAGLAFAVFGGIVARKVMDLPPRAIIVFALTSMIGIAAGVYGAMFSYNNTVDSFLIPYLVGSPIGALIVAVPLAFLGCFAHPLRAIALATALPTAWAVLNGALVNGDAALEPPGLAALYIGWQMLFLLSFALSPRRA